MEKLLTGIVLAAIALIAAAIFAARLHDAANIELDIGRTISGRHHCAAYDRSPDCQ